MEYMFDHDRPIYLQLVEQLRMDIVSGKYQRGEKIPSVRELALTCQVNPNTMQKALLELEREKLIYTERTNGKYVTEDDILIQKIKDEMIQEKIVLFLDDMSKMGVNSSDVLSRLRELEKR